MKTKKGFTLMEVIITIALLGIILSVLYNILFFQIKTFSMSDKKSVAQSDVRYISDFIANEVRYATNIEILQAMPSTPDVNYKYLYVNNDEVYYKGYGTFPAKKLNIEDRKPSYNLSFSADDESIVNFALEADDEKFKLESSINLINTKITASNGAVVKFKTPDFNSVLSFLDKSNRFWYDLVKASLEGSLNTAANYNSTQTVDGGVLALNIKSTGIANGGASMFVALEEEAFLNAKGDISSYSMTVDAKLNGTGGGYGILINGTLDTDNEDTGYMFQFDPGASGFLLRYINDGEHVNSPYLGANRNPSAPSNGTMGVYLPSDITNADFKWATNNSSDWLDRYKTEVKVQTQANGSLIIRAVIIDENGNRSNEMWFGDFGKLTMPNGTVFTGKSLQYYNSKQTVNDNIFGLRVWDNTTQGIAKTDFYNIAIGSAEPAPKAIGVNNSQNNMLIKFDDKIASDVALQKDNFVVKDIYGTPYQIQSINKTDSDYSLQFTFVQGVDVNGNAIIMPPNSSQYIVEYKKPSGSDGLKDSFGNTVTDFVFDKGFYKKQ